MWAVIPRPLREFSIRTGRVYSSSKEQRDISTVMGWSMKPVMMCGEGAVVVPVARPGDMQARGDINHGPPAIDRPDNGSAYHLPAF